MLTEELAIKKVLNSEVSKTITNQIKEQEGLNDNAKAREKEAKAAERQAAASEKAAKKAAEEARPYKQLALAFAAAAKEAQDLGAKYGTLDKRSQAAAKRANELNNELKKIDASIGNHQRNVGNYGSAFDKVGTSVKNLATNFLGLLGIVGVGSIFKDSVDEFLEMDKNVRQLQNTLKNLGVPEAFDRISASANRLQKQFGYIDNDDILKSFNQLIVYGKLTEDQMNDLIPVIIDFAAASGQSLEGATSTVIKALEGNGKALKEYGINMKDAKTTTEAFGLVMTELKPKVDGVAKSFQESAAGGLATAKQEFKDLKEEIGAGVIPILNSVIGFLLDAAKGAKALYNDLKDLFTLKSPGSTNTTQFVTAQIKTDVDALIKGMEGLDLPEKQKRINGLIFSQQEVLRLAKDNQYLFAKGIGTQADDIRFFGNDSEKKANIDYAKGVIKLLQERKKVLQDPAVTNKVLGIGDPNKPFSTGAKTKGDDPAKKAAELAERNRKAQFEATKAIQEDNVKIQEDIFKDETQSFDARIAALRQFIQEKARLIELERTFEKGTPGITKDEVVAIEAKKQAELNDLVRNGHQEYNKILEQQQKEEVRINKENAERIKKIHEDLQKSIDDGLKEANERLKETVAERQAIEKEAAGLREELIRESVGLGFDLITRQYELEKNLIQESIDALERKKLKDIEVANATITNAQDRAAAITIINDRAAAEEAILEQKKRQVNIKQAQFDKDESIANIIESTAEGVINYASKVATAPLVPLVIAIGAAQLARVIATPIPKYRYGTSDHKGGPAIVGDGGKSEGIRLPDGTILKSPSVSTMIDLPKGSQVYPDFEKMMLTATMTRPVVYKQTTRSDRTTEVVAGLKSVEKAIKRIPQTSIQVDNLISKRIRNGNSFNNYITRSINP